MTAYELQPDGTLREVADPPTRADIVHVVRCGDCERYEWREHLGRSYCHGEYPTEPDGFCAWGKRRESE